MVRINQAVVSCTSDNYPGFTRHQTIFQQKQPKQNPRQRQGLRKLSGSVTLFPPREFFSSRMELNAGNWHSASLGGQHRSWQATPGLILSMPIRQVIIPVHSGSPQEGRQELPNIAFEYSVVPIAPRQKS